MKSGQGEPLSKSDNPFLRENLFEPFIKAKRDQANLVRRCKEALKESLKEMRAFCREESELADVPEALWPGKEWLENFSANIITLASVHKRGRKQLPASLRAIENRYPAMMLSRSIKNLVVRAARFYQEPFAIHIQRQGIDGNQKATECFDALKRCRDGTVGIASEDWETYRDILQPESAETCQTKAAQTIIDWRREEFRNERPWGPLVSWLTASGNFALAAKLTPPESANASASTVQAVQKRRRKELAVQRQRKYVRRKLPEKCMMRVIGDQMRRTRVIKAKK